MSEIPMLNSDDMNLKLFLKTINMENIFDTLKAANITYRSLPYLDKDDLKEALPPLGLRAEFREKLFAWKNEQCGYDDETSSGPSRVQTWLNQNEASTSFTNSTALKKDLKSLLSESTKGKAVIEYAAKNQKFNTQQRDDIISIIIEDAITNKVVLYAYDFVRLTTEICTLFPFENNMREYYYIPRSQKNNAGGKMYSKYRNKLAKKRKLMVSTECSSPDTEKTDFNESVSMALKISLNSDNLDWKDVCCKWKQTYNIRQKELKNLTSDEFLKSWSKLSDCRVPELINIDFDIMHPGKGNLLISKWQLFKQKILSYYNSSIHNESCKQLLASITPTTSTDTQDFIYTILLNAVLPSGARFKNQNGKCVKRVTIADSKESLVLRLTSINDYKQQIDAVISKYYSADLTIQPFIIVEGISDTHINSFYVYFNNNLLKFNTFIKCLDTCFKIFHILSLRYPKACLEPWLFIQTYFYNIERQFDVKTVNLTSLMSFLNNSN
ncbi:uncharacterized protein LOC119610973 isoform X1 [Lucilia sericata]|uniref:uncharacterized protein LOC119610973 isoform X1 n=1 Tax=Lucilia sericata TaxID=13632 RepID=UPI0018A82C60|nr:uncharacterized protein LOC119610973 isoform X1 [Lucilia sericata]